MAEAIIANLGKKALPTRSFSKLEKVSSVTKTDTLTGIWFSIYGIAYATTYGTAYGNLTESSFEPPSVLELTDASLSIKVDALSGTAQSSDPFTLELEVCQYYIRAAYENASYSAGGLRYKSETLTINSPEASRTYTRSLNPIVWGLCPVSPEDYIARFGIYTPKENRTSKGRFAECTITLTGTYNVYAFQR